MLNQRISQIFTLIHEFLRFLRGTVKIGDVVRGIVIVLRGGGECLCFQ